MGGKAYKIWIYISLSYSDSIGKKFSSFLESVLFVMVVSE